MEALVRLPNLSRADFQQYWRSRHAPLILKHASALGISRYTQIHAFARESEGEPAFDGYAQVEFESLAAFEGMLSSAEGRAAAKAVFADEREFIDRSRSLVVWGTEQLVI